LVIDVVVGVDARTSARVVGGEPMGLGRGVENRQKALVFRV
jgi:hypothetical protein